MTEPTTSTINLPPDLQITLTENGAGRPVLILHGGGGPFTVAPIANHLAETMHTIMPTHPGWNGTIRPDWISGIDDLAATYLRYLENNDLQNVLVIGSSLGGWIGAEMALHDNAGLITDLVLINAVGIEVEDQPIRDFFALNPREVAEYSFHDAERFYLDPTTLPPERIAAQKGNMATMRVVAGDPYMHNPTLRSSLASVKIPVLVIWGESDRIVTPAYGTKYAEAFPNARFELVKNAGHLPQIEQPDATMSLIDASLSM